MSSETEQKVPLNVDKILAFKLPMSSDYFTWLYGYCEIYNESQSWTFEDRRLYGKLKSEKNNIIIAAYKWSCSERYELYYYDSSNYLLDQLTFNDKDELLGFLSQLK